jgi:hypothetical protein
MADCTYSYNISAKKFNYMFVSHWIIKIMISYNSRNKREVEL